MSIKNDAETIPNDQERDNFGNIENEKILVFVAYNRPIFREHTLNEREML